MLRIHMPLHSHPVKFPRHPRYPLARTQTQFHHHEFPHLQQAQGFERQENRRPDVYHDDYGIYQGVIEAGEDIDSMTRIEGEGESYEANSFAVVETGTSLE